MAQATLDRVLDDIQTLPLNELTRVRSAVDSRLSQDSNLDNSEQLFVAMKQAGLITEVKRPNRASKLHRLAVPITGVPLSETIIEDRR